MREASRSQHGLYDRSLPCSPFFTRLLTLAHCSSGRPAIRDLNTGMEKSIGQLLADSLSLREVIRSRLPPAVRQDIREGREVYIGLLAAGGYEFAVGFVAILALGAAINPLSHAQPVGEAQYYINKSRSVAVVCAAPTLSLGHAIREEVRATTNPDFLCIPIQQDAEGGGHIPTSSMTIMPGRYQDHNDACLIIWTSGTSGPPKGAVLSLGSLIDGALCYAELMNIRDSDTVQHVLPVHHATGIWTSFLPFLLAGACVEFRSGSFDPAWVWDRWKRGGITHFSGVPTIYMRLMHYYQETLERLAPEELATYRRAVSQFRLAICGTSALPKPVDDFWAAMMNGKRIKVRYGSTELGVFLTTPFGSSTGIPDGAVGLPVPGVDVVLSEGDEGEILGRSPYMFSRYIHDPNATKAAFTKDGYYKTGDLARCENGYYFIAGRESIDIIKSGGYKISTLDVEREIMALPYVGEVMVVGVPDPELGQRTAAVVSLSDRRAARQFFRQNGRQMGHLRLEDLRSDLRGRLAGYKLPTLLRVIDGELPKSTTNKVVKKMLGPQYFPSNYQNHPEVQIWSRGSKL